MYSVTSATQVSWSDPKIKRSGVIPLCRVKGKILIGLAVGSFTFNINIIGGCLEDVDSDWLTTAVREFNEEVGGNFPSLTEEAVMNFNCIVNEDSVYVVLPLKTKPESFTPTEEVTDMIWITSGQLSTLISSGTTVSVLMKDRPLVPSVDLVNIGNCLVQAIRNNELFRKSDSPIITRTPILRQTSTNDINMDIQVFISKISQLRKRQRICIVVQKDTISFTFDGKQFHILSMDDIDVLVEHLQRMKLICMVSSVEEKNILEPLLTLGENRVIHMSDFLRSADIDPKPFIDKISLVDNDIVDMLKVIEKFEYDGYLNIKRKGLFQNTKRLNYIRGLILANETILFQSNVNYHQLVRLVDNTIGYGKNITDTLIRTGLLNRTKDNKIVIV